MSDETAIETAPAELAQTKLRYATTQEIQLELIRRRSFRAIDGQRVAECLTQNRDLWEAVLMDRLAISHPGSLPTLGLMKLRDLSSDEWNVDTLYVLTRSKEDAEKLAEVFDRRKWGGLVDVYADPEEVDNALGGAKPGQSIVAIWWD